MTSCQEKLYDRECNRMYEALLDAFDKAVGSGNLPQICIPINVLGALMAYMANNGASLEVIRNVVVRDFNVLLEAATEKEKCQ
jgi:hypothetical protein